MANKRADHNGVHNKPYLRNKKIIFATQTVCGICGRPVDFSLKFPHPMSATVDHIIPVARGGHPSDISKLHLAHFFCNRQKSDKNVNVVFVSDDDIVMTDLPWSADWKKYKAK